MLGKIYIDESGFTGADYCNEDQPLYVLACTWFEPDFARRIEDRLLSLYGHKELKFSRLIRKEAGRQPPNRPQMQLNAKEKEIKRILTMQVN